MSTHGIRRLDLFVTERCNLACAYCFAASQPMPDLPEDKLLQAVSWLLRSDANRIHLTLWGGEPLLRVGPLQRVVDHARQQADRCGKRVTFSLPTNASLIRDDTMAWLEQAEVEVFLSIDGDETGQRTRPLRAGGSSHRLVSSGMRRALATAGRPPAIRMTLSPQNARRVAANVGYFIDHGARKILIYPATDQPWSEAELSDFACGQQELADWFIERMRSNGAPAMPVLAAWQPILRRLFDGPAPRPREGPLRHCGVGTELVAFGVDERLWPCHRFLFYGRDRGADLTLGSLRDGVDQAQAARFGALRIEQLRGAEQCVDCRRFELCTQGCLAVNYAGTGRLDRIPITACALMEAQIAACEQVHEALRDDPTYGEYLGRPVRGTLEHAAAKLGARAHADYESRCAAQPHEEGTR